VPNTTNHCGQPTTRRVERVGIRPGTDNVIQRLGTDYACDRHVSLVAAGRRMRGEEVTVWPADNTNGRQCRVLATA
jgi:hypothetical protein